MAIHFFKVCDGDLTTYDITCEDWPQEIKDHLAGDIVHIARQVLLAG